MKPCHLLHYLFVFLIAISGCSIESQVSAPSEVKVDDKAQQIVDQAIARHGGDLYNNSEIALTFRGKVFNIKMAETEFSYSCQYESDGNTLLDTYNNLGEFTRLVNGELQDDIADKSEAISQVNSVPYFALLPFKLNDPAVIKSYVGEATIQDQLFHKIKVTFQTEGGGKDPDNIFYYWFNKENYTLDFMAYSKYGNRFRQAINQRQVGGITFNDYINFKSDESTEPAVEGYDKLFEQGKLRELSRIIHENVQVRPVAN